MKTPGWPGGAPPDPGAETPPARLLGAALDSHGGSRPDFVPENRVSEYGGSDWVNPPDGDRPGSVPAQTGLFTGSHPEDLPVSGKRRSTGSVVFICLVVVVVGAMVALMASHVPVSSSTVATPGVTNQPTLAGSSSSALPLAAPAAAVVSAVDLPLKPSTGAAWTVDTTAGDSRLVASNYVTECGVLVSIPGVFATVTDLNQQKAAEAKEQVVGYKIDSGTPLWSFSLPELLSPGNVGLPLGTFDPTYTSDCHMVIGDVGTMQYLVLDLTTGQTTVLSFDGPSGYKGFMEDCEAAGDHWVVCAVLGDVVSNQPSYVVLFDLTQPGQPV